MNLRQLIFMFNLQIEIEYKHNKRKNLSIRGETFLLRQTVKRQRCTEIDFRCCLPEIT